MSIETDSPVAFLVELTPEQMRTFWNVTNGYEEDQLGSWDAEWCDWPDGYPEDRAMLRSLQSAVESARPIWE